MYVLYLLYGLAVGLAAADVSLYKTASRGYHDRSPITLVRRDVDGAGRSWLNGPSARLRSAQRGAADVRGGCPRACSSEGVRVTRDVEWFTPQRSEPSPAADLARKGV